MNDKSDILALLAHNEELVGELYRKYAGRFPELKEFWNGLAQAENMHSAWLSHLNSGITEKTLIVTDRFSPAAVTTFQNYLIRETADTGQKDYSEKQALTTALYIEKSFIEKDFYQCVTSTDRSTAEVLEAIMDESREHLELIRKKMKEKGLKAI